MTEQLSEQSHGNRTAPDGLIITPQAAAVLLVRIDAMLDELYAMRQTVRQWADAESDALEDDTLRETALAFSNTPGKRAWTVATSPTSVLADPIETARLAAASLPADSLVRQLAGSLGSGRPEYVYTNAEIDEMRFGDEWL